MKVTQGLTRAFLFAGVVLVSAVSASTSAPRSATGAMVTGGITSQPIGHYEFCKRLPAECEVQSRNLAPVRLTKENFGLIVRINALVNRTVAPVSDNGLYNRQEWWAFPDEAGDRGDCEDFALQKRRILVQHGISPANVLLTVVRKPDGEGHAVLTVRTDKGDFVLDNLADQVLPWNHTGYRFLKRQAENHSGRWSSIRGGSTPPLVGAVRSTTR